MVRKQPLNQQTHSVSDRLPPLESGDHLTRPEFERRYHAMPHLKKAELIEGVVYMPAALRFMSHGRPHALLMAWLTDYWLATPGTELGDNPTVRLDMDNEPQPDAVLLIGFDKTIDLLLSVDFCPPNPPTLGGIGISKSPRIGGFRGHSRIYARDFHELSYTTKDENSFP